LAKRETAQNKVKRLSKELKLVAIMGHSDPKMMRRYAHLTPEHKRKAINALPEWKPEGFGQNLVRNSGSEKKSVCAIVPQANGIAGAQRSE
jgi:hypothetical protein